jgi:predicted ATPase
LFFIALAYHPTPPKLILLEEPENGIHPKQLADVVRLLRDVSKGVHGGSAAQVVLTTHSPYLLDHIDLETDQVLVFRRNADGTRSAEPADVSRLKTFLDEFMLGEVWFNEEEKGLVAQQV